MSTSPIANEPQLGELASGEWRLDPARSTVEFHVPHFWGLMTVRGRFHRYEGSLDLARDPAVELKIEADSLDTGNRKRDQHLRSADFFHVEQHPEVRFVSASARLDGSTLRVRGQLQARGASIPLELDGRLSAVDGELRIEAETQAVHRDLGMTWSPLRMTRPHSRLIVKGSLVRATPSGG
jgi:polyisoprenoid-binding protein YceI